jgi:Holliday junction resolvase RusA-like endonuclease
MTRVAFVAYGNPAPKGSKRGFFNKHTGRVALVESSKREKPWRQDVMAAALSARNGAEPLDGPLVLRLVFTMPKPKSAPKSRRSYPDRKPDVDKLMRSVLDALVAAGVIADDARVVEVTRLAKVFPGEDREALEAPGVRVEISGREFAIAALPQREAIA